MNRIQSMGYIQNAVYQTLGHFMDRFFFNLRNSEHMRQIK